MKNEFNHKLNEGFIGEGLISKWLQKSRNYNVLPAYEKDICSGKGPRLFTGEGDFISPDMLVFKSGDIRWVEAKTKSLFSWHRISEEWVTGIDIRHFHHYLRVKSISEFPLYIMFLHTKSRGDKRLEPYPCPTGLFCNEIDYLRSNFNHKSEPYSNGNGWGKTGMVYWNTKQLKLIAPLVEVLGVRAGSIIDELSVNYTQSVSQELIKITPGNLEQVELF